MLSIILPNRSEQYVQLFMQEIEDKLPVHEIIVSLDRENRGKGWALREGFMACRGDQIAFLDADGEIPPRMLYRLLPFLEDFDVVVGSKRITRAPLRRKIMTRLTRWWFKLLFGVKVDTQTGIKLFNRRALDRLNFWASNGFIFDVEIIVRLQEMGFEAVEVPIECEIRRQVSFKTILRILGESIWLKCRLLLSAKR